MMTRLPVVITRMPAGACDLQQGILEEHIQAHLSLGDRIPYLSPLRTTAVALVHDFL